MRRPNRDRDIDATTIIGQCGDPGPQATGDQYANPGDHTPLPATFADGLAAFAESTLAESLGSDFTTNFIALTTNELALYNEHNTEDPDTVSAWELARYAEFS